MRKIKLTIFLAVISLALFGMAGVASAAYQPPVGIPAPSFGIEEVAPAWPSGWPSSPVVDYYYIDNTHPAKTDTANTYGYPDKPRATIPEITYPAGSYIEIHGGPYDGGGQIIFTANGTATSPVWFRGFDSNSKPIIRGETIVKGSYAILENLYYDTSGKNIGLRVNSGSNLHHAVVRNSEFVGAGTNIGNSSVLSTYGSAGNIFTDIVFYNNLIHGFGDVTSATENDYHGVAPSSYVDNVWVLNNHIYDMGGDSVQVGAVTLVSEARPNHIYIGGNTFYDNRENSVDIKQADNVIVSQNIMHGAQGASSDPGGVVVVHNGPTNVWILNNEIYDGNEGITSTGSNGFYVMGNKIYNIHRAVATVAGGIVDTLTSGSVYRSGIGIKYYGTTNAHLYNNTIADVLIGIAAQINTGNESTWANNIVSNVGVADGGYHLIMNGNSTALLNSVLNNSVLYQSGGSVVNSASFFGQVQGLQLDIDPKLVNILSRDFRLQSASPAIGSGILPSIIATFQSLYGLNIAVDYYGTARPQGSAWDIGAYEYISSATDTTPPSAPSSLAVI